MKTADSKVTSFNISKTSQQNYVAFNFIITCRTYSYNDTASISTALETATDIDELFLLGLKVC